MLIQIASVVKRPKFRVSEFLPRFTCSDLSHFHSPRFHRSFAFSTRGFRQREFASTVPSNNSLSELKNSVEASNPLASKLDAQASISQQTDTEVASFPYESPSTASSSSSSSLHLLRCTSSGQAVVVVQNNDQSPIEPSSSSPSSGHSALDLAPATLLVNTGVSAVSFSSLTAVTLVGVDFNLLIAAAAEYIPALSGVQVDPVSGVVAVVIGVHALIAPARYAITGALMPWGLPYYRRVVKPLWQQWRSKTKE